MNPLQYFLSPGDPTQFCKNRCVETKCGEFVVPEEHLTACSTCNSRGRECGLKEEEGEGVDDVDFLLYVSARDTKQCGGKIGKKGSLDSINIYFSILGRFRGHFWALD